MTSTETYPDGLTQLDAKELGIEPEELWQAADKLRGSVDAAERIQEEALPVMRRHAEELTSFFSGFNYLPLICGSEAGQLQAIIDGANYVLAQENGQKRFMNMVARRRTIREAPSQTNQRCRSLQSCSGKGKADPVNACCESPLIRQSGHAHRVSLRLRR